MSWYTTIDEAVKLVKHIDSKYDFAGKGWAIDTTDVLEDLRELEVTELKYNFFDQVDGRIESGDALDRISQTDAIGKGLEMLVDLAILKSTKPLDTFNTYNYNANLLHGIEFRVYPMVEPDRELVLLFTHLYGDARANYTKPVLLMAGTYEILDKIIENNRVHHIPVDGEEYLVELDGISETQTVYNTAYDELGTIFASDIEDAKEHIRNLINELKEQGD